MRIIRALNNLTLPIVVATMVAAVAVGLLLDSILGIFGL